MNKTRKLIIGILLFGSLWGGLEAIVTASMNGLDTGLLPRSAVLAFIALLVTSFARIQLPQRGSTIALGLVAAGFKLLGLPMLMGCQFQAVIGQAIILEAVFTALRFGRREWRPGILMLVMILAGYVNALSFSFAQAYFFRNDWWLDRGVNGLFEWSFTNGTLATIAGVIAFVVGYLSAHSCRAWFERLTVEHRIPFERAAMALSLCLWMLGAVLIRG